MERKNEKKKIACVKLCGVVDSSISIIIRSIDLQKIRKMFTTYWMLLFCTRNCLEKKKKKYRY